MEEDEIVDKHVVFLTCSRLLRDIAKVRADNDDVDMGSMRERIYVLHDYAVDNELLFLEFFTESLVGHLEMGWDLIAEYDEIGGWFVDLLVFLHERLDRELHPDGVPAVEINETVESTEKEKREEKRKQDEGEKQEQEKELEPDVETGEEEEDREDEIKQTPVEDAEKVLKDTTYDPRHVTHERLEEIMSTLEEGGKTSGEISIQKTPNRPQLLANLKYLREKGEIWYDEDEYTYHVGKKIEEDSDLLPCPECGETRHVRKKGKRKTTKGRKQRYYCKECDRSYTEEAEEEKDGYSSDTKKKALECYREVGSSRMAAAYLEEKHGIDVHHSTVTRWVKEAGIEKEQESKEEKARKKEKQEEEHTEETEDREGVIPPEIEDAEKQYPLQRVDYSTADMIRMTLLKKYEDDGKGMTINDIEKVVPIDGDELKTHLKYLYLKGEIKYDKESREYYISEETSIAPSEEIENFVEEELGANIESEPSTFPVEKEGSEEEEIEYKEEERKDWKDMDEDEKFLRQHVVKTENGRYVNSKTGVEIDPAYISELKRKYPEVDIPTKNKKR